MYNEPIYADFNNREEDNAVRIFLPFKNVNLQEINLTPHENDTLWITDGEVEMRGALKLRNEMWVVLPDEKKFTLVDEKAPYHYTQWTTK